jgi:ABC-type transport system involved in multi-copper enzyme maturation permease subunit
MKIASLIQAEVLRELRNRVYWSVALGGIAMVAMSIILAAPDQIEALEAGLIDSATVTRTLAVNAFAITLFTSVIGILVVTRDFGSRMMSRVVRLTPSQAPTFIAKAVAATVFCLIVGLLSAIAAVAAVWWTMRNTGYVMDLGMVPALFVIRHALHAVLSGLWGVFLGFLVRSSVVAITVQAAYLFVLEATIIKTVPSVGRWLIGGAGSAVVDDPTAPWRFGFPAGVGIYAAWVLALAVLGYMAIRSTRGVYVGSGPQRMA